MTPFIHTLKQSCRGAVCHDPLTRQVYSVDASIYEVEPLAIFEPVDVQDLAAALKIAYSHQIPVTPRGAATGITGGCLGKGLIIDLARHLTAIEEINIEKGYAICQAGVVQDQLNHALAPFGYRLGPDTSTGDRATLGGMLANNAAGARSLYYGCMADHLLEVEWLNARGEVLRLAHINYDAWSKATNGLTLQAALYRQLWDIRNQYQEEIQKRFPKLPRIVSGYRLPALLGSDSVPLCTLLAGAEGTLGIVTKMKVKIVPKPTVSVLCLFPFEKMLEAMPLVETILPLRPLALEMIDHFILEAGRKAPSMQGQLEWLRGSPQALLFAEFEGEEIDQALKKARDCCDVVAPCPGIIVADPTHMQSVWKMRKAGLGLLLSKRSYSRAIAFIEDIAVPPDRLTSFLEQFLALLERKGKRAGIYGHAGAGCLHIRPYIDLRQEEELEVLETIQLEVLDLLLAHGGVLSGEHGDGLIRSWLNKQQFGEPFYKAFEEVKRAFDPEDRLNPGKVVNGEHWRHDLRLSPSTPIEEPDTFQDFSREGGLALAADMCNGNGLCRKKEGIMCPSFQATGNEYDTTRARAQSLRAIIHQKLPPEAWTGEDLHNVLDLCLSCKGCKRECPSEVDMAKMKAEVLYHYQEKHGYSWRNRGFGHIGRLFTLGRPIAPLINGLNYIKPFRMLLEKLFGISTHRRLPHLQFKTFFQQFSQEEMPAIGLPVLLVTDTFTEFNHPEIGFAAVKVLRGLGYQVLVSQWKCCGRPMLSKGLLKQAAQHLKELIEELYPFAHEGVPIIGLEPSCLTMLSDDSKGLLGKYWSAGSQQIETVAQAAQTFDAFVYKHLLEGKLALPWKEASKEKFYLLHGHCHQRALEGTAKTKAVLRGIPGAKVQEIDSGCCGMAGSFGYEAEHEAISMKIGELKLFPTVRAAPDDHVIVANGTSCRAQIFDGTGKKALHLAEALAEYLK